MPYSLTISILHIIHQILFVATICGIIIERNDLESAILSTIYGANEPTGTSTPKTEPPWILQQFFDGQLDLGDELSARFKDMPMMSVIKIRSLGQERTVVTLSAQNEAARLIFDLHKPTASLQTSFVLDSMLSLSFKFYDLGNMHLADWISSVNQEQDGVSSFLWGDNRWEDDYLVSVKHKYFTSLFAFSPRDFEAAVAITSNVTQKLMDWFEKSLSG